MSAARTVKMALVPTIEGLGFFITCASPFFLYKGYGAWSERLKAETAHQKHMQDLAQRKATEELRILKATARSQE